jgi:hypothetical protein
MEREKIMWILALLQYASNPFVPFPDLSSIHLPNRRMHTNKKTQAIRPYAVLCPSTPFFLLALVTYITGIIKFNITHKVNVLLGPHVYLMMFISAVSTSVDWRNILVSLQIFAPMNIWAASILLPVMDWLFGIWFPRTYEKMRERWRRAKEEKRAKVGARQEENDVDVEARLDGEEEVQAEYEMQGEISKETFLRS